jgi:hypothetical protein
MQQNRAYCRRRSIVVASSEVRRRDSGSTCVQNKSRQKGQPRDFALLLHERLSAHGADLRGLASRSRVFGSVR